MSTQGQYGFTYQVPSTKELGGIGGVGGAFMRTVMSAAVDDPLGLTWGVNLASWSGGVTREALGMRSLRARITWGGGSGAGAGSDTADIDYPSQGTSVMVHGAYVKVDVLGQLNAPFVSDVSPVIAGWLTRGATSMRPMSATLTEELTSNVILGGTTYVVPARARAYRLLTTLQSNIHVEVQQLSGNATPVTGAVDVPMLSSGDAWFTASNRAQWFPLAPNAATIVVTPLAPNVVTLGPQWLIELG